MTAEINIAAASLIVASTAFVIAIIQLLQSIFGHIEGYRRCAQSVVGAWSRLRRRRLKIFELRVEVKYTTPHFSILSSDETDWWSVEHAFGRTYDLVNFSRPGLEVNHGDIEVLRSSLQRKSMDTREATPSAPLSQSFRDVEMNIVKKKVPPAETETQEVRASWLSFLNAVHKTYSVHCRQSCIFKHQSAMSPSVTQQLGSNIAAVSFIRRSWDFMPSDLTTPLATSTLNTLILLALRMNMDWKELDMGKRSFMADGNGYTLTSNTEMGGLGIVFYFTATGKHDTLPVLAPSEAVDKTIFGIIPSCEILVNRDFPLIGDDRREDFEPLFEGIGIDRRLSKRIAGGYRDEPRREAMILLSSFIPLKNCPILFNYFPGFRRRAPWTPIHSNSGRAAFLELLEDRVKKLERKHGSQPDEEMGNRKAQEDLKACLQKLHGLFEDWRDDFLCTWKLSVIQGSKGDKKIEFSNACRKVFEWATITLKKTWSTGDSEKNQYTDLVAAHCIMSFHAIEIGADRQDNNTDKWREKYEADKDLREKHKKRFGTEVGKEWMYRAAESYVASINTGKHSVVKNLRAKGCNLSENDIEAAWWIMMVKGIAWDMSTTGGPLVRDRQQKLYHWTADYVPSKFYTISTPVWIG